MFLESKGANVRADNDYPIKCAYDNRNFKAMDFLISKGVDITNIPKDISKNLIKCMYEIGKFDSTLKLVNYFDSENNFIKSSLLKIQNYRHNFMINLKKQNYIDITFKF